MRHFVGFSCVVTLLLLSTGQADAGPGKGKKKDPAQVFQKRDKDSSGSLTVAELDPKGRKTPPRPRRNSNRWTKMEMESSAWKR